MAARQWEPHTVVTLECSPGGSAQAAPESAARPWGTALYVGTLTFFSFCFWTSFRYLCPSFTCTTRSIPTNTPRVTAYSCNPYGQSLLQLLANTCGSSSRRTNTEWLSKLVREQLPRQVHHPGPAGGGDTHQPASRGRRAAVSRGSVGNGAPFQALEGSGTTTKGSEN